MNTEVMIRQMVLADYNAITRGNVEKCLNIIMKLASDKNVPPNVRLACCEAMLSRAFGKPRETIDIKTTETRIDVAYEKYDDLKAELLLEGIDIEHDTPLLTFGQSLKEREKNGQHCAGQAGRED
jgi:hypothetical protein